MVVACVRAVPKPLPNGWGIGRKAGATMKLGGATLLLASGGSGGKLLPG